MSIYCRHCGLSDFRPSKFRSADIGRLIVLQLPVRCTTCKGREFVSLTEFFKLKRAHRIHQVATHG
jgi:hypothetical protein